MFDHNILVSENQGGGDWNTPILPIILDKIVCFLCSDGTTENEIKTPDSPKEPSTKPSFKAPIQEFDNPVYDAAQGEFEKDDLALIWNNNPLDF